MAKPRVFISSTFYDLKHIRSSLEQFVQDMGYDAVLSEKGDIAYDPDKPLDESCYRETGNSDIFVLIIGGRYGSNASDDGKKPSGDFFERYTSITKREYETAAKQDIPIYILIDKSVYTEYETFKRNREKENVEYAHVDSVNVFRFIDDILNKPRNNPIQQFERHTEITAWLREQWSGLFKEMLSRRSEQQKLTSLTEQVNGLAEISTTLKRYLELIISNVAKPEAKKLIKTEEERLEETKRMQEFAKYPLIQIITRDGRFNLEEAKDMFSKAQYLDDIAKMLEERLGRNENSICNSWRESEKNGNLRINEIRKTLGLDPIGFKTSADEKD